jgi:hypothetical protein
LDVSGVLEPEVTSRGMGKPVLRVARDALTTGEAAPAPYGSRYSRRD